MKCPDCGKPLHATTRKDKTRYWCNNPQCLVIEVEPRPKGEATAHREAVARDEPYTWLTLRDVSENPKLLEMK